MKLTTEEKRALRKEAVRIFRKGKHCMRWCVCPCISSALEEIAEIDRIEEIKTEFAELFKPKASTENDTMWGDLWGFNRVHLFSLGEPRMEEAQQCRALALLLFVEMHS